jgi:hypothetical protein
MVIFPEPSKFALPDASPDIAICRAVESFSALAASEVEDNETTMFIF